MTFKEFDSKWYPFIAGAAIIARDFGLPDFMQPGIQKLEDFCKEWRKIMDQDHVVLMTEGGDLNLIRNVLIFNDTQLAQMYPFDHPARIRARRGLEIIGAGDLVRQ